MLFHASVSTAKSAVEGLMKSVAADLAQSKGMPLRQQSHKQICSKIATHERMVNNTIQRHPKKILGT